MKKREPALVHLNLKVVGNHLHRCNIRDSRYTRENHYAIFVLFENFLRFQVKRYAYRFFILQYVIGGRNLTGYKDTSFCYSNEKFRGKFRIYLNTPYNIHHYTGC